MLLINTLFSTPLRKTQTMISLFIVHLLTGSMIGVIAGLLVGCWYRACQEEPMEKVEYLYLVLLIASAAAFGALFCLLALPPGIF